MIFNSAENDYLRVVEAPQTPPLIYSTNIYWILIMRWGMYQRAKQTRNLYALYVLEWGGKHQLINKRT